MKSNFNFNKRLNFGSPNGPKKLVSQPVPMFTENDATTTNRPTNGSLIKSVLGYLTYLFNQSKIRSWLSNKALQLTKASL